MTHTPDHAVRRFPRALRTLATMLLLAGCASGGGGDGAQEGDAPPGSRLPAVVQRLLPDAPGTDPAEAQRLLAQGAPSLAIYMLDRGGSTLMLRAGSRDGVDRWRSADNVQIYLRAGQIIGTRGLGFDLMSADTGGGAALVAAGQAGQVTRIHRYLDGQERIVIRAFVCDIAPGKTEDVRIPDGPTVTARRITETCHSPTGRFVNLYWTSGRHIVQTRQFIAEGVGRAQIVFLE